jgi:hypothetical protein
VSYICQKLKHILRVKKDLKKVAKGKLNEPKLISGITLGLKLKSKKEGLRLGHILKVRLVRRYQH